MLFQKNAYKITFLAFLVVLCAFFHLFCGSVEIPVKVVLNTIFFLKTNQSAWHDIIVQVRIPRMLTALIAGASLSLAGLQMQTLFKNPMAGPDVLGLTSGSGLGVAILIFIPSGFLALPGLVPLFAFLGALMIMLFIIPIARLVKDNNSLLIIGIMLSAITSSVIGVLQYLSNANEIQSYLMWTFGRTGGLSYSEIRILLIGLLLGISLAFVNARQMNVWGLGEHYLKNLNFNILGAKMLMIFSACILTGVVTAYCGPIAFVGLVTPLLIRNWFKTYNHQWLVVGTCFGGSLCLLVCDIIINTLSSSISIPINVATALFGAPVVIYFIFKLRKVSV